MIATFHIGWIEDSGAISEGIEVEAAVPPPVEAAIRELVAENDPGPGEITTPAFDATISIERIEL